MICIACEAIEKPADTEADATIELEITTVEASSVDSGEKDCPMVLAASSSLYLRPEPELAVPIHANGSSTTWHWQLSGEINEGYEVDVYDVDLFTTSASTIKDTQGAGKKVVCYFSAGSIEDWRHDFDSFSVGDMGSKLEGWTGERWLDIRLANVLAIMHKRLEKAVAKDFDEVEPDNIDGYQNDQCFALSNSDQLRYNREIANHARSLGLAVGLKNYPDQVSELLEYFDFSVTEQCYEYSECPSYQGFVSANKPVFNAEYDTKYRDPPEQASLCKYTNKSTIQTLVLDLKLDDSYRYSCDV